MQILEILLAGFVGTSAMTLFSYRVSRSKNKNFREPQLLNELIDRLPQNASQKYPKFAGWGIHYTIGLFFVACYSEIWDQTRLKPSFASGTVMGAVNGIVGVMGWKLMFKAHPNPPAKDLTPFFGHLIIAHMVFGVFSAITFSIAEGNLRKGL